MRILVTYAVQGEFTELKFPGLIGEEEVQVGYLRTGVVVFAMIVPGHILNYKARKEVHNRK